MCKDFLIFLLGSRTKVKPFYIHYYISSGVKEDIDWSDTNIEPKYITTEEYFFVHVEETLGGRDAKEWSEYLRERYKEIYPDLERIPFKYFKLFQKEVGKHKFIRSRKGKRQTSVCNVTMGWNNRFEFTIEDEDLIYKNVASGGPGGQNRDKSNTKAQVIYKPLKMTVSSEQHRNLGSNRELSKIKLHNAIKDMVYNYLNIGDETNDRIVRIYEEKNRIIPMSNPSKTVSEVIQEE